MWRPGGLAGVLEGPLETLSVQPGEPAHYHLAVRGAPLLALNERIGSGLLIEYLGGISCGHCGRATRRSYGEGFCYACFTTLARCDLCVVSPARCHYHLGTCREPDWGRSFCMQPHRVYLANSSGPKVGITRLGRETTRWLDQGASQGLVVADASTRHLAGVLEAAIGLMVSDRTDWRTLLAGDVPPVDLAALRDSLPARLASRGTELPEGVAWRMTDAVQALTYPILGYPRRLQRWQLLRQPTVSGRLLGVKGQYLLFAGGVFSIRHHRGYQVRITTFEAPADDTDTATGGSGLDQMELFT